MKGDSRVTNEATEDALLAELVEEYTTKLQAGEDLHWSAFADAHPERADGLRRLLPALHLLADAGVSSPEGASQPAEPAPLTGPSNGQLGDYRLVREIGRGGMGIVYEAEQRSLRRRVAVKVLPYASLLDSRQLQRFHNEAQAAACLHHDHIVPVFAVGCEEGVHFYAMQFIDGRSLDQFLSWFEPQNGERMKTAKEAVRAASTAPHGLAATIPDTSARISLRAIVQLAVQAAEALDHAHQQGVVHRDIKPANLLVNREGDHLWITDFGLARCQGEANLTRTGDLLGTLRYMSPEQALARPGLVDHRTDIYALGATLYELLALRPVFSGQSRQELLQQIADEEPLPLRRIDSRVPIELETIVLKALAKSVTDRYATARDFADDLERYLDDRPILARRPTVAEKTMRWCRRHKGLVSATLVATAILFVAMSISTFIIVRQRDEARDLTSTARTAVDDMYLGFVQKWLSQKPQLETEQHKLLLKALHFYERFAGETNSDPQGRLRVARAWHCVADIRAKLGANTSAQQAYRQALAVLEALDKSLPRQPEVIRELAGCWNDLGNLERDTGESADAEIAFRNARVLYARQANVGPDDAGAWAGLAGCSMNLGAMLGQRTQNPEAESLLREAVAIDRHWVEETPRAPSWRYDLAAALGNLADLLTNQACREEAEASYVEALTIWTALSTEYPDRLNYREALVGARCSYASLLAGSAKLAGAEMQLRKAIATAGPLASDYPSVVDYAQTLTSARTRLARVLVASGKIAESEALLRENITQLQAVEAAHPDHLPIRLEKATAQCELGELLENKKEFEAADVCYRQAAKGLGSVGIESTEKPEVAWLRAQIAARRSQLLFDTGHIREASEACELALSTKTRVANSNRTVAGYQADLAWSLLHCCDSAQRDPRQAVEFATRATELRPKDSMAWLVRGAALNRAGQWQESINALEKSRSLGKENEPAAWFYLALSFREIGEKTQARQALGQGEQAFARLVHPERAIHTLRDEARKAIAGEPLPLSGHRAIKPSPVLRTQE
jgi:eukaryotic-like serine/threonine-protein kinase